MGLKFVTSQNLFYAKKFQVPKSVFCAIYASKNVVLSRLPFLFRWFKTIYRQNSSSLDFDKRLFDFFDFEIFDRIF